MKAEKKEIAHFFYKSIFCLQTEVQNEPVIIWRLRHLEEVNDLPHAKVCIAEILDRIESSKIFLKQDKAIFSDLPQIQWVKYLMRVICVGQ